MKRRPVEIPHTSKPELLAKWAREEAMAVRDEIWRIACRHTVWISGRLVDFEPAQRWERRGWTLVGIYDRSAEIADITSDIMCALAEREPIHAAA